MSVSVDIPPAEFKFAHIADIHARDNDWGEIKKCLDVTRKICCEQHINFTVIAGDLWDCKLWSHSESFRGTIDWVRAMAELGPIYLIYGTPSHDVPGSYAILQHIGSKYPIHIINEVSTLDVTIDNRKIATVAALPHITIPPSQSLEQTMEVRREALRRYITLLKEGCDPNFASIFIGHLAVIGCVIPQGTDGYEIAPVDIESFSYSALGHVHPKDQKLPGNIQYSGSLWHTETGDISEKGFFVVSVKGTEVTDKTFFNAGSYPVVKLDAHFTEEGLKLQDGIQVKNAKVRLTVYVPARIREAFDAKLLQQKILDAGAVSCRIVPRILQEDIDIVDFGYTREVKTGDWLDKFHAYCEAKDIEITPDMLEKATKLVAEVEGEEE